MRKRLLTLAAATTSLVVVAFLIPLSLLVGSLARKNALNEGLQQSQLVASAVEANSDKSARGLQGVVPPTVQPGQVTSSVALPGGTWVGPVPPDPNSASLRLAQGSPIGVKSRQVNVSYHGGLEIWQPIGSGADTIVVRTFVPASIVDRGVVSAIVILVLVGLVMLGVALLIADRIAQRTARPVTALATTANRLSAGDLGARAPIDGPREVIEVGLALNRLAARIAELLNHEREQVADLSHRLRTPVAAVRLAAEALPDSAEAGRLTEHVEALERAIGDVIREARRGVREAPEPGCDVVGVVRERVGFWEVLAEDQGRRVELRLPAAGYQVKVAAKELAAAVDALLENVFAHTPEGTGMEVAVEVCPDGTARVTVADAGPGIPRGAVDRGASGSSSTGLGLDIVRRTAEASGGCLEIGVSAAGGAAMVMQLGGAPR